jgi:hypothetical protein
VAAGVAKGELLVGIGRESAANLTHDEAIERLRQPARPLKLRLRRLSAPRLQVATPLCSQSKAGAPYPPARPRPQIAMRLTDFQSKEVVVVWWGFPETCHGGAAALRILLYIFCKPLCVWGGFQPHTCMYIYLIFFRHALF